MNPMEEVVIDADPIYYQGKPLRMTKAYTFQNLKKHPVITDDLFTFVEFYFAARAKAMKYREAESKERYGNPKQYHYTFYWQQSKEFYNAAKQLPIHSSPLASYYSMLNAAKALIAYRTEYIEDFIKDFGAHGLQEVNTTVEEISTEYSLKSINIKRLRYGVFKNLGELLDGEVFDTQWVGGTSFSVKQLLYNIPFVHDAYMMTYSHKGDNVEVLFLPLRSGRTPEYYKGNDKQAYLVIDLDQNDCSHDMRLKQLINTCGIEMVPLADKHFTLRSVEGIKYNTILSEGFKSSHKQLRSHFVYIKSDKPVWYLKRSKLNTDNKDIVNVNTMLLMLAIMHRFSEIVRYKPEQLNKLMKSKENWLIHEFLNLTLDQFIDEIAAEITGQDIMCTI